MAEKWKWVVGYEGKYKVSDQGRVKSVPGKWRPGKILNPWLYAKYYPVVSLRKNRTTKKYYVHTLVLEAFVGLCPINMECRHLDDNPSNNKLENLCWGTHSENLMDAHRNGKFSHRNTSKGENRWSAKLTEGDVKYIRGEWNACGEESRTKLIETLSRKFCVTTACVRFVVRGKTWKHVKV